MQGSLGAGKILSGCVTTGYYSLDACDREREHDRKLQTNTNTRVIVCVVSEPMYGCRIGRRWRWCFLGLIILLIASLYLLSSLPALPELAEVHTCPACFGTSLCPAVASGALSLTDLGSVPGLIGALGAKNVFFGSYNGHHVVLKKLGHTWELQGLDRALCVAADLAPDCKIKEAVDYLSDIHSLIMDYVSQSTRDNAGVLSSFHLCPSADNLDVLLSNVMKNRKNVSSDLALIHIWTLLHLNAEPLILQILPGEESWPVPRYLGACGRLVVEEYAGQPLSEFTNAPWPTRAHLAKQLLHAAFQFTDKHPAFRFYLTDISLDNVAVDAVGNVKFVDLENIIILDKNPSDKVKPATWGNQHELLVGGGSGDGLLAAVPSAALIRQPVLPTLLQQCAHSPGPSGRRTAAAQLVLVLEKEASFPLLIPQ